LLRAAGAAFQRRDYIAAGGRAGRALHLLQRVADAARMPVDRQARLRALVMRAACCRLLGRLHEAGQTLRLALLESEFCLGRDHPDLAAAWSELALVYAAMNESAARRRGGLSRPATRAALV
jgi:hypothetical protein